MSLQNQGEGSGQHGTAQDLQNSSPQCPRLEPALLPTPPEVFCHWVCLYLLEVEKDLPAINTPVRAVSCKSLHITQITNTPFKLLFKTELHGQVLYLPYCSAWRTPMAYSNAKSKPPSTFSLEQSSPSFPSLSSRWVCSPASTNQILSTFPPLTCLSSSLLARDFPGPWMLLETPFK